jgi:hypothetical protein
MLGTKRQNGKTVGTHLGELDPPYHPAGGFAARPASRASAGAVTATNGCAPLQRLTVAWDFCNWEAR